MKASEILSKAADLIEPEGKWIQFNFANGCGFCAAGAIANVSSATLQAKMDAANIFRDFLDDEISAWNDAPERTQSEVVSALRQAASLAKEREGAGSP